MSAQHTPGPWKMAGTMFANASVPHLRPLLRGIEANTERAIAEQADDDDALRTAERHYHNPDRGAGGMSQAEWDREGLGGCQ